MASKAYTLIVLGPDDIVGFVAYSLYKEDKMRFILDHTARFGEAPDLEVIDVYLSAVLSEGNIQRFRQQALGIVNQILEDTARARIDEAIDLLSQEQIEVIDARIRHHRTSHWQTVGLGISSSFLFAVILTLCQLIAKSVGGDLFSLFK